MREAIRRLGERQAEVRRQEVDAQRRSAYEAARIERDATAEALAEYPALAERLCQIMSRVAASDAVIERLNCRSLPEGAAPLAYAELVARGLPGFVNNELTIYVGLAATRFKRYEHALPGRWGFLA